MFQMCSGDRVVLDNQTHGAEVLQLRVPRLVPRPGLAHHRGLPHPHPHWRHLHALPRAGAHFLAGIFFKLLLTDLNCQTII